MPLAPKPPPFKRMPALPPATTLPIKAPAPLDWPRSLMHGAVAALVSAAIVLTLGVLAFSPLGAAAAQLGVPAAFVSVVVSAGVLALLSRCALPVGGPSSATALIYAALVARLAADPLQQAQPMLALMAPLGAAVVLMGLLQCLMARLGLASLARFVPQPVLAGFMNGIALLILAGQLPTLLAIETQVWQQFWTHAWGPQGLSAWPPVRWGALFLGLGTAACIWLVAWREPRLPAALLGLVGGVLAYHAALALWPSLAVGLGPTLGALPAGLPPLGALALWDNTAGLATLRRHAPFVLLAAALLALIGTLESMLALRALDQQVGQRHNGQKELTAMGLANIAGGLFGAVPMVHLRARALVILQQGSLGLRPALGAVLASAVLLWLGGPLIAHLPGTVLAGVMVTVAFSLADRWSRDLLLGLLRRRGLWHNDARSARASLAIVASVAVLTVWQGPAFGVATGVLLSTWVFVRGLNRSIVRSRCDATALPSRRMYPQVLEATLAQQRQHIQVLELEGALFFGSAERVADEAHRVPQGCQSVVLDLRRVTSIDESGAMMLHQLELRLARSGVALLLAGVGPGSAHQQRLTAFGAAGSVASPAWFLDTDHAVEAAERGLLDAEEPAGHPASNAVALSDCSLLQGLSASQQRAVIGRLKPCVLQAGERLFDEGDPDDGLYLLTRGSISVRSAKGQRFVSFSAGTMLGEMAMLDGQRRSAAAYADSHSEVHLLSRTEFESLALADPVLCALLYRNIAVHLSERLRVASMAWRSAAG